MQCSHSNSNQVIKFSATLPTQCHSYQLDTGADISIANLDHWKKIGQPPLQLSKTIASLSVWGGRSLQIEGECTVKVSYNGKTLQLPLTIVHGSGTAICGRNWLKSLQIDLNAHIYGKSAPLNPKMPTIGTVKSTYSRQKLDDILNQFPELFSPGLGHCSKIKASLHLRPDAQPRFFKPRPIPFARQQLTNEELQRNVDLKIIEKIDYNPRGFAAPMVVVPKPNNKVRICGDFKVTINPQIDVDEHPIPTVDELFLKLNGGEKFTKLDLADAYLQIELEEESKNLVVINTPLGLFRYNCMPFSISSAPAIFQRVMDELLAGIPFCAAYLDDIIITGRTEEEHLNTLKMVLTRLKEFGFKCHKEKCDFFRDKVTYVGHVISKDGKRPDPKRVEPLLQIPNPTCICRMPWSNPMLNPAASHYRSLQGLVPWSDLRHRTVVRRSWSLQGTGRSKAYDTFTMSKHFWGKSTTTIASFLATPTSVRRSTS
uniref:Reverse transcriptase domain-containing protein n=1 Tax=Plectus sambesii TaxID=2011161 RepID=A0A914W0Y7_9BILA